MYHSIYKITTCKIISPYTLELTFNDGLIKKINFEKILYGEMYSPLSDLNLFNRVKIDPEVFTIVWPNGADFDPSLLHDWEEHESELANRAKEWDVIVK
ncbi:MAG: DUF2442 domain-containing protein [Bacteroidota bacterium]|nr:DUF2442 domain-containing protein [Bacteroidota bacterium]